MAGKETGYIASPGAEHSHHFEAIGRLIVEYARAEAYVHYLASWVTDLGTYQGMAIFGGMRLPDLIQCLRACMRADGGERGKYYRSLDVFADLDACFTQLDVISKARHKIAHRYIDNFAGASEITTHTAYTAKSLAAVETEAFTLDELSAMTEDCFCIRIRILRRTDGEAPRKTRSLEGHIFQPWRYKPRQPKPRKRITR